MEIQATGKDVRTRQALEGKLGTVPCGNVDLGIRPCIYLNLGLVGINGGSGTKDDPYQLYSMVDPVFPAPTQAPVEEPILPTAAPVIENDNSGDALSQLIDQMAQEKEDEAAATPVPTEIPVETPAGRAEYAAAQRAFSEESQQLRARILDLLENLGEQPWSQNLPAGSSAPEIRPTS